MGTPQRLTRMHIAVLMRDGATFTVTPQNADMVSWERYRALKNLPGPDVAPFTTFSYLAWHNLTVNGSELPNMSLGDFEKAAEWIQGADQDESDLEDVDPTNRDHDPE